MRVKEFCNICSGSGCDSCDKRGYDWRFKRDPEVSCQGCGESFRDGSEEAEFIGWHGVCSKCMISDENVEVCDGLL